MEEFLLLIHGKHYKDESPLKMEEHATKYFQWMEELVKAQKFIKGHRLSEKGVVLNTKNDIVSDGPYLEAKEAIGGYVLIRAENLEDAIEIAKACPLSNEFKISIRPMFEGPNQHEFPR